MTPYFPEQHEVPPYYCPNCKAWYRYANISCCVLHPPGGCCHMYETRVERESEETGIPAPERIPPRPPT